MVLKVASAMRLFLFVLQRLLMHDACNMHRRFNWWRVDRQVDSCEKLTSYDWIHLLPGHGRPGKVADPADREHQIKLLAKRERARGPHLDTDHSGMMVD